MIESITIIGGRGKDGDPEPVDRIDLQMGSVASIVVSGLGSRAPCGKFET